MVQKFEHLMTPFQIGSLTIKNRFTVAPMGDGYLGLTGPRGEYSWMGIEHCVERAKGGFGLMINGCVLSPDNKVDEYDPLTSVLDNKDIFIKQGLLLNERCSFYGMKVFQQITLGLGRNWGHYSPSQLPSFDDSSLLTEGLTTEQIKQKIDCVIEAAELMKNAGFAGVEIHALHWGYLLDELAMDITNPREDEYGGSLENRMRACKEIAEGIKKVCGSDYPISMRLGLKSYIKGLNKPSLDGEEEAGRTLEEGIKIAQMLEEYGYDVLNVDVGMYDSFYHACPPIYMPQGHVIPLAAACKKAVNIPVICGSRMNNPELCEQGIADGSFDAVALGRPSLVDPNYVKKVALGRPDRIRPCIGCTVGCMGRSRSGELMTCSVNPQAYLESCYDLKQTRKSKHVMVIGGGIAGMEAALTLKIRGFEVDLYEEKSSLGGLLALASKQYHKGELQDLVRWYEGELKEEGVRIHLGEKMGVEKIKKEHPDTVIFALGGQPHSPAIQGIENGTTVVDFLSTDRETATDVLVIGGGLAGCETAIDLAAKGKKVTIVESGSSILANSEMVTIMVSQMIFDLITHYQVTVLTDATVVRIDGSRAVIRMQGEENKEIKADEVIIATGMQTTPTEALEKALWEEDIETYAVGDCKAVGNVYTAVHSAYEIARNV